ncbi:MAG TPA: PAS domain S-box protein [Candidatus Sulfotelmatobacter sp.]|jgi:PAS domain S-box-containing protein|nr:PAS domain S-box protein [Candidatus Sulfotelmatobacter sp.]
MGDRVTQSRRAEIAHANRLKKALDSGAPPAFVQPANGQQGNGKLGTADAGTHVSCSPTSCPLPPLPEVHKDRQNDETRLQFLEQMFQASPDGLSLADLSHRVLLANETFVRMFEYEAAEVVGQPLENLVVPPDRLAESQWVTEALAKGQRITLETQRRKKDGSLLDVSMSCAPLFLDGKMAGFYAGYHDISDRRRVEALSSALYRVAEKSSSAHDLQQFFAAVHGIVDELMYGRNFYIALYDPASDLLTFPYFVDEQDTAPAPKKLGRGLTDYLIRAGQPLLATPEVLQAMEERGEVARNGSRSLDWMGVPLKVNGHTFGALVVQTYSKNIRYGERDKEILTFVARQLASAVEIKKNEQALRRSEARYRSLVQSSVYGIYRSSLEGRFLDVNPALITMLGYGSAEEVLLLDPTKDVFAHTEEHTRLIDEFRRTGRLDGIEVKWKRSDGTAITVRISGRAVSSADEPADVLEAIAEDVTDRRVLEDQFRQAQKMEAVGRLAGGVAHDFNNLLMVISGYAEVMLAALDSDHRLREKALAIQQASDRATTLTRQLLAFSRKQLLELKVVDVNAIVADMERLLRPLIGENVQFITSLSPDAAHIRADAGQLEQVLMNLVVNAKDAMPNGGTLTIQTEKIVVDESHRRGPTFIRPGHYVLLSVSDTGMGMDKETQSRIFEPFFTTKEKGKGTGLGLSTVYGIVKQSGGYVMVQSEVNRGTTFQIYLPRVEGLAERHPAPAAPTALGGSETVLLVEDEESVRQLVRETLAAKGYRVMEASNGEGGLSAAAQHNGKIDLVITDVVMPGMGGRELVKQLAQTCPETKVLYLSGYTEDAIFSEGTLESGAAFLQKPFTLQSLARKVREVLG